METFELEFEIETKTSTPLVLENARALAERTAELLEETVEDHPDEYTSAAVMPVMNAQGMSILAPAMPTGAEFYEPAAVSPTPAEIEAAVRAVLLAQRSARGASAHYGAECVGAYIGRRFGARRTKPYSNQHDLVGVPFQIRTINGSQGTWTLSKKDPDSIFVAAKKRDAKLQGASRYMLYGVLRDDACAVAKKSRSRGHVKSGHQLVPLAQVRKVELGSIIIPDDLVLADTSEQRLRLLERISMLEPDLNNPTVLAAGAFLAAALIESDTLDSPHMGTQQPAASAEANDVTALVPETT
jgi:hypothetical protein